MKIVFFILFSVCILLNNCSANGADFFSDTETILIVLPEIPAEKQALFNFEAWQINYFDVSGIKKEKNYSLDTKELKLLVKKNRINPVSACLLLKNSVFQFKPAGGLYPFGMKNQYLYIRWQDGVLCHIAERILQNSQQDADLTREYLSYYNWHKLQEKINEFDNPWLINQLKIIHAITQGKMTIYDCQKDAVQIVLLPAFCFENELFLAYFLFPQLDSEKPVEILSEYPEQNIFISENKIFSVQKTLSGQLIVSQFER